MSTGFFKTTPTSNRSNFNGTLGYEFTPSQNIVVDALGRNCSAALSGDYSHRMAIWRVSDSALVAGPVTLDGASPVDGNGLSYESLTSPVTLVAGTAYVIGSEEFNTTADGNKDAWRDQGILLASGVDHEAVAAIGRATFRSGSWGIPITTSNTGSYAYVYGNFYYSLPGGDSAVLVPGLGLGVFD